MLHGTIEKHLIPEISKAVAETFVSIGMPSPDGIESKIELEIPKDKSHGDISSNISMKLAAFAKRPPIQIADIVRSKLEERFKSAGMSTIVDKVETKHPGFINFFLSKDYLCKVLLEIKRKKAGFGKASIGRGIKLQIEFVSANPTGPLTIAHGRQAAIGDSLANIMDFLGYDVTREYYLNDEGTQMDILGNSIRIRYRELSGAKEEFPENGYKGAYVTDIAKGFKKRHGKKHQSTADISAFREFGLRWILDDIKKDLKDFGVKFDVWYSQKGLRKSGKVEKAIAALKGKGYIYENENAVWFKSTAFGDDKTGWW